MSDPGHHAHAHAAGLPLSLLALGAALAAYLAAAWLQSRRGRAWSAWRTASWAAGLALLGLAAAPPLAARAHHDLQAHMLQHLLVGMFAPLGLVLAAPVTLLLRTLPVPQARRLARLLRRRPFGWLGHPALALVLNVGGMYLLYLTPLFALSMRHAALHALVGAHVLAAGCLFTWAIAGPDPAPHRPPWRTRLLILCASIAAHATLAKLMVAYGWPRGAAFAPAELEAAAQLMYYGGDLAELLLAVALFAQWFRGAARSPRPDRAPRAAEPAAGGSAAR
jgi:putative membrane protein